MQVSFEYPYYADVKTKYSVDYRWILLKEFITLQFNEVPLNDAPVAVAWNDRHGVKHHTRFYNGRHYTPAVTQYGSDALKLLEQIRIGKGRMEDFSNHVITVMYVDVIDHNHPRIVHIKEKTRERALSKVYQWAEDCIVIDGVMYLACAEPYYLITRDGMEISQCMPTESCLSSEMPPFSAYTHGWYHLERYSLHDRDSCLRDLSALERSPKESHVAEPPIVFDPVCVGHMDLRLPVYEAGKHILSALAVRDLAMIHPSILHSVVKLSGILWDKSSDEINFDDLSEAIVDFREVFDSVPEANKTEFKLDLPSVDQALRRWGDAEISLQLSAGPQSAPR